MTLRVALSSALRRLLPLPEIRVLGPNGELLVLVTSPTLWRRLLWRLGLGRAR